MNWLKAFDRPIAFHPIFAELTGSVHAALMLSQAIYWTTKTTDKDGWFYKTREQWQEETYLTRYEQAAARKILVKTGFWQEARRGQPARMFYRIDIDILKGVLDSLPTRLLPDSQLDGGQTANKSAARQPTLNKDSETTSETTHALAREGGQRELARMPPVPAQSRTVSKRAPIPFPARPEEPEMVSVPASFPVALLQWGAKQDFNEDQMDTMLSAFKLKHAEEKTQATPDDWVIKFQRYCLNVKVNHQMKQSHFREKKESYA